MKNTSLIYNYALNMVKSLQKSTQLEFSFDENANDLK